ncbi:MAG: FAD-dependent oxidoreductase [Desulfarculus sp.]|nr:FAD-dependent oxidoreductase [Desulfarculus sp.]
MGQDVPAYLSCLAQGQQDAAMAVILEHNPLPAVLGHVCHHPCQEACLAAAVQAPPAIHELKRFAALGQRPPVAPPSRRLAGRVAVVGSGPAGLAAAWALARGGLGVTIYEAEDRAGGLLAWGIPPFRLPPAALKADLDYILAHGVKLELNRRLTPGQVREMRRKHVAVVLACGAPQARRAGLPGAGLGGVHLGLDFVKACALGRPPDLRPPVLVVGGGNLALDAARWALRLAQDVTLVYRRDQEHMPAYAEEIAQARAEGVEMLFRAQPVAIEGQTRVRGLRVVATAPGALGSDGRPVFAPLAGQERLLPAGAVILALGQESQAQAWAAGLGLESLSPDGQGLLAPGLHAAGDLASGPATVVEAVASGIRCGQAILAEVGA